MILGCASPHIILESLVFFLSSTMMVCAEGACTNTLRGSRCSLLNMTKGTETIVHYRRLLYCRKLFK